MRNDAENDRDQSDETRVCADCGDDWFISEDEIAWFIDAGLVPPRRCKQCRAIRKQNAERYAGG